MKETEQRIAIAEACGWLPIGRPDQYDPPMGFPPNAPTVPKNATPLPDYLNDLNAMHEAINTLSGNDLEKFANELARITYGGGEWHGGFTTLTVMDMLQATPAQRCEAFLRTLNLWKP